MRLLFHLMLSTLLLVGCRGEVSLPGDAPKDGTAQDADDGADAETAFDGDEVADAGVDAGGDDGMAVDAGDPGGDEAGDPVPDAGDAGTADDYDLGPVDVSFIVDSGSGLHPISRYVYGVNGGIPQQLMGSATLDRFGGNRLTAYNWENNASNAGSDWGPFASDDYLCWVVGTCRDAAAPGEATRVRIEAARAAGAAIIVTVPILGKVAADKDGNVSADQVSWRFRTSVARKGQAFSLTPDQDDQYVYQDEFVNWVDHTFPDAPDDPTRAIFYSLDNEPALWSSTHALIHPEQVSYTELSQKCIDHAGAIKDVVPSALVFAPVLFGWSAFESLNNSGDYQNHGDFLDWFLDTLKAAGQSAGRRLLDVLDLHWYPEARGNGVRITFGGVDDHSGPVAAARMQAPRSLWDPDYVEDSWISNNVGAIRLLPRVREKIASRYPGTRLAVTEYNYGGGGHISGAIAQAEVLGIFGREEVFAANFWHLGSSDDRFIFGAFRMFRNYDDAGGVFGDTSVAANSSDIEKASVYASLDSGDPDRMVLVVVNKTSAPLAAGIEITHGVDFGHAEVYRLTEGSPSPQRQADLPLPAANRFVYTLPPLSVSTLELRSR